MHTVLARAKELRRAELKKKAQAYAEAGNQPMEIVLREIINREKSKNTLKKIKRALDKSSRATLTKLIIPMLGTEEEKTITTKDEIHESIINYNIEHININNFLWGAYDSATGAAVSVCHGFNMMRARC